MVRAAIVLPDHFGRTGSYVCDSVVTPVLECLKTGQSEFYSLNICPTIIVIAIIMIMYLNFFLNRILRVEMHFYFSVTR